LPLLLVRDIFKVLALHFALNHHIFSLSFSLFLRVGFKPQSALKNFTLCLTKILFFFKFEISHEFRQGSNKAYTSVLIAITVDQVGIGYFVQIY
jgi:hypothetical protein